jgi:hypothetical protein
MVHYKINTIDSYQKKMESKTNGHQDNLFEWTFEGGSLHGNLQKSLRNGGFHQGVQIELSFLWVEIGPQSLVHKYRLMASGTWHDK